MKTQRTFLILAVAITLAPLKSFGDIHEDQFNQLKSKQVEAIKEVNRKYSEVLLPLLEKVKANKNEVMTIKIRQELCDIGFPHKDDWILGEWEVAGSDSAKRTYVFTANGAARYTKFAGSWTGDANEEGQYTKEENGSVKVSIGKTLMIISQVPNQGIQVLLWKDIKDYPDKSKCITGTAKH